MTDGYRRILDWFPAAHVLGVTATPDRGDLRNLGEVFDSLAYEYKLTDAIREGFLCRIMAQTIPLQLDISTVGMSGGDYAVGELGGALDPYLDQIAAEMARYCKDRKTVVFLPLIKTSQKFRDILNSPGFRAAEVNGQSEDRAEVLFDFSAGKYNVLCNWMLLTEGWDCPSVDCVVVLRPTKVRSLYSQMCWDAGTRLSPEPGKKDLLLLDFLWLTDRHELCRPADLICEDRAVARQMTENLAAGRLPGGYRSMPPLSRAGADVVAQREEALAKQLAEHAAAQACPAGGPAAIRNEHPGRGPDRLRARPSGWEIPDRPATPRPASSGKARHSSPTAVDSAGKARMLLDRLDKAPPRRAHDTRSRSAAWRRYGFTARGHLAAFDAARMHDRPHRGARMARRVPQGR